MMSDYRPFRRLSFVSVDGQVEDAHNALANVTTAAR
jgi:hypothetical protein